MFRRKRSCQYSSWMKSNSSPAFAGKADNIYITVKSGGKKKKYWAGCNEDIHASARRDQVKSELKKLSPDLVK